MISGVDEATWSIIERGLSDPSILRETMHQRSRIKISGHSIGALTLAHHSFRVSERSFGLVIFGSEGDVLAIR